MADSLFSAADTSKPLSRRNHTRSWWQAAPRQLSDTSCCTFLKACMKMTSHHVQVVHACQGLKYTRCSGWELGWSS